MNIKLLPEQGPFGKLYAHINTIAKELARVRSMPSSTVRVKETTNGTSYEVVVPPKTEGGTGEPIWL